ncbi:OPT oligopeptide transporter [Mycena latifolia]|nr:OPT oligopeptide transporter [Mycena latifolia]
MSKSLAAEIDGSIVPVLTNSKSLSSSSAELDLEKEKVLVANEDEENVAVIEKAEDVAIQILSTQDDPSLPSITFRSILLGLGLSAFSSVSFFSCRPQTASVSPLFCLIVAYVVGNAMHSAMPTHGFWRFLNPGPFNIKEHTAILIMSGTASGVAAGMEVIAALDLFYDLKLNPAVAIFQIFATQMIGYGVAGFLRSFLVYPTYAFYPGSISIVNLLQSLHWRGTLNAKKVRFFWIVFAAIFFWEWIPLYPFPLLTAFSIICLADNGRHAFVRNLFGGGSNNEGIGLLSLSTSWTLISQGLPLVWPLQTQINSYIGMGLGYIVLASCYYSNIFNGRDLPWMSTALFSSEGDTYNQSAVITADFRLNYTALETVGLPRFTSTYAISQLCSNLSLGAAITSLFLWHWPELCSAFRGFQRGHADVNDPHYKEMQKYAEVPQWVYGALFIVSLGVGIGCSYAAPHGTVLMPAWSIIFLTFRLIFNASLTRDNSRFPISIGSAVQVMVAFMHPGTNAETRPVMYGNLYGHSTSFQVCPFLYLKLGQYTKLPPRVTFGAGSIVGAIFNYTMMETIVTNNRAALIDPIGTRLWTGWITQQYNSASIAMGALGKELFVFGKPYWLIPFAIFLGLFMPLPVWLVWKFSSPKSRISEFMKYLNLPIILLFVGALPAGVNGQWTTCMILGVYSQWWLRKKHPRWFRKYNYIMSTALDGGSSVVLFILSLAVFGASGRSVQFPFW